MDKVPILVARYAGQPVLLSKVAEAVHIHQSNELSVQTSLTVAKVGSSQRLKASDIYARSSVRPASESAHRSYIHVTISIAGMLSTYPLGVREGGPGIECKRCR